MRVTWLCMCCLVPVGAGAAELTLEEVQARAQAQFPSVLAAEADVATADAEALAARGGFDPSLTARAQVDALGYYKDTQVDVFLEQPTPFWGTTVGAGYRLGAGNFPDYQGGLLTNRYGEVRGSLTVPLIRNGPIDRRRAGVRRSELGLEASAEQKRQTVIDVVRAASVRYFVWVGAGLRRRLAEQMLALANERDAQTAARVRSGDLADFERIDNQRTIAQRQALLVQSDRALQQAAIELSLYLRDGAGKPIVSTVGSLPERLLPPVRNVEPEGVLVERALNARPDLKRTVLGVSQSQVELSVQKNQLLPSLDARLIVSQDLGPGSSTRQPFELTAGVVLDIPLAFRLQRGRVKAAEASLGRAELLLGLQRDRVVAEVRDALSAENAALDRLLATQREAELAVELARLERARFSHGESTILIVNLRETAALEAQARAIDATVDAQRARIDLAAVTAALVPPS